MNRSWRGRSARALAASAGALLLASFWLFPGERWGLGFTLATGVGREGLQARIDAVEAKAIARSAFSAEERAFLGNFYRTLATGAKLTVLVGQTGRLMDHYLDGSGRDYQLESSIFRDNRKVQVRLSALRAQLGSSSACRLQRLESETFYMPDASQLDSVFGLYYGKLVVQRSLEPGKGCIVHVRAEVPWLWPSYASLLQKHGSYHAESFPLPNAQSLLLGPERALLVDNGLGQYLVELGLARPFLAFGEWIEP